MGRSFLDYLGGSKAIAKVLEEGGRKSESDGGGEVGPGAREAGRLSGRKGQGQILT